MNLRKLMVGLGSVGLLAASLTLSGCSTITPEADGVTLHYKGGPYDGNKFDRVVGPGESSSNWSVSDHDYQLPTNVRAWKICGADADQAQAVVVNTKPADKEVSGIPVAVCAQVNMKLNTYTGDLGTGFPGGTLRKFWENVGHRYQADTDKGWLKMMNQTVVPTISKAIQDAARNYSADELVGNSNGVWTKFQNDVVGQFNDELKRLNGGNYFCGPDFDRGDQQHRCSSPAMIVSNIDFANPEVQKSRDNKRIAAENAAAQLTAANGTLAARNALNAALNDPNYLRYLQIQNNLEAAKACAAGPHCVLVVGGGNVTVQVPN